MMIRCALIVGLFVSVSASLSNDLLAGDGHNHSRGLGVLCPRCAEPCYPSVSKAKTTKSCYTVECKPICIPAITFPWQKCNGGCDGKSCQDQGCARKSASKGHSGKDGAGKGKCPEVNCQAPAKCGRVRYVNVLRKQEWECSTCKYSWSVNKDGAKAEGAKDYAPTKAKAPEAKPSGATSASDAMAQKQHNSQRRIQRVFTASSKTNTTRSPIKLRFSDLEQIAD